MCIRDRAEELLSMKVLSLSDRRLQYQIDARNLATNMAATAVEQVASNLRLITERGYHRGQDLEAKLAATLEAARTDLEQRQPDGQRAIAAREACALASALTRKFSICSPQAPLLLPIANRAAPRPCGGRRPGCLQAKRWTSAGDDNSCMGALRSPTGWRNVELLSLDHPC